MEQRCGGLRMTRSEGPGLINSSGGSAQEQGGTRRSEDEPGGIVDARALRGSLLLCFPVVLSPWRSRSPEYLAAPFPAANEYPGFTFSSPPRLRRQRNHALIDELLGAESQQSQRGQRNRKNWLMGG